MRVVDDIYAIGPRHEHDLIPGAPDLKALDSTVVLKYDSEIWVAVLHDLEAGTLPHLDIAMPGVQTFDLFLGHELSHLLERVRTHAKNFLVLSQQHY